MYGNQSRFRQPTGFGAGGAPPRDLLVLLGVLLLTYSLRFFEGTQGLVEMLLLTPEAWQSAQLWRLATYPFVGEPGFFFLLTLLILFWFGRDVMNILGRQHFWRLIGMVTVLSALVAVLVDIATAAVGLASPLAFTLMQGSGMLMTILISAFATLYRNATIMLMFVVPVKARWFLWLMVLFAFMGFLPTKDFAGFVGTCTAVGATYSILTSGGLRRAMKEYRLRLERLYLEAKMNRSRKQFRVVKRPEGKRDGGKRDDGTKNGGDNIYPGPWVN